MHSEKDILLLAHDENIITAEDSVLLNDLNTSRNLNFSNWLPDYFELDLPTDAECKSLFNFFRNDIYKLAEVFNVLEETVCYNRFMKLKLFNVLKRFANPCR